MSAATIRRERETVSTTTLNRLPESASIFTAELFAIRAAYFEINSQNIQNAMIVSDSLSAVQSIHPKYYRTHPLLSDILEIQNVLEQTPILLWIPSHTGIPLNEKADEMVKEALKLTEITRHPSYPRRLPNTYSQTTQTNIPT